MYSRRRRLVIGFHGCDREVRDRVVSKKGEVLTVSDNTYDWLGNGIYFWENNYDRALAFAKMLSRKSYNRKQSVKEPAVLGAVIDLGHCFDLLDSKYLGLLKEMYEATRLSRDEHGIDLPKNEAPSEHCEDLLYRYLDCAVIQSAHEILEKRKFPKFDSVRGVFFEGSELYPTAGFKEKNHIQIAIRNPNCIKGYFIPREIDSKYSSV